MKAHLWNGGLYTDHQTHYYMLLSHVFWSCVAYLLNAFPFPSLPFPCRLCSATSLDNTPTADAGVARSKPGSNRASMPKELSLRWQNCVLWVKCIPWCPQEPLRRLWRPVVKVQQPRQPSSRPVRWPEPPHLALFRPQLHHGCRWHGIPRSSQAKRTDLELQQDHFASQHHIPSRT